MITEEYKVLVVEDHKATLKQMDDVVKSAGFISLLAENGDDGLEIFKKEKPDIIITDLKMPGINGIELMSKIKEKSSYVQVILITAFGEDDVAISALCKGALDYIKKPINLEELSLALDRAKEKIFEYKKNSPFPTILFAEDDERARKNLFEAIENEGWKVFPAVDGEDAINIFKYNKIDIVILDIKMPKKDGLQVLHEMRSITKDFEAIIISGYGDESSAIQAMRDGAYSFIKKPIDLEEVFLTIEKALEKLNLSRVLKYRLRELELANKIIQKIERKNKKQKTNN